MLDVDDDEWMEVDESLIIVVEEINWVTLVFGSATDEVAFDCRETDRGWLVELICVVTNWEPGVFVVPEFDELLVWLLIDEVVAVLGDVVADVSMLPGVLSPAKRKEKFFMNIVKLNHIHKASN
jgi:hypothetical protein